MYNCVANMNLHISTQMAKKADAWKEYEEAALVDMMLKVLPLFKCLSVQYFPKKPKLPQHLQVLPSVAAEVSTPLSKCKRIQMVSDGDGPVGASRVSIQISNTNANART